MPVVDIDENINKIRMNIDKLTQEVFKLQGMLQTFEGFKQGGLVNIDLPNDPTGQSIQDLDSVQEKPE
jgi:hypothetical protein